jgi:hypothetical protein
MVSVTSVIGDDSLCRRGSVTLVRRGAEEDANARGDAADDAMRGADAADASAIAMRVRVRPCPAFNAGPVHFLIPLDNHERCDLIDDNGNIYLGDEVDRAQHL